MSRGEGGHLQVVVVGGGSTVRRVAVPQIRDDLGKLNQRRAHLWVVMSGGGV